MNILTSVQSLETGGFFLFKPKNHSLRKLIVTHFPKHAIIDLLTSRRQL